MAKTTILGLNLTEDENTSFSDWRKTIDGNGSGSAKSNFQIIDEAIGALGGSTEVIDINTYPAEEKKTVFETWFGIRPIVTNFTSGSPNSTKIYQFTKKETFDNGDVVYSYIRCELFSTENLSATLISEEGLIFKAETDIVGGESYERCITGDIGLTNKTTWEELAAIIFAYVFGDNAENCWRLNYTYIDSNPDTPDVDTFANIPLHLIATSTGGVAMLGSRYTGDSLHVCGIVVDRKLETIQHIDKEILRFEPIS